MANVNEGEREWTIMTAHKRRTSSDGQSVGVSSWVRGPALSAPIDVVPTEALREAERDLLAVVDMWRGRFEDAASRETGLHEALRKETGALREAEAEVARLREALVNAIAEQEKLRAELRRVPWSVADASALLTPGMRAGVAEAKGILATLPIRGSESEPKTGAYHFAARITPRLGWSWVLVGELDRVVARSDARYATRELALRRDP